MPPSKRQTQAPYESLFSELSLHVLLVNTAGRIVYANPRAESALAAESGALKSLMLDSLFSLRNPPWLAHEIRQSALADHWTGEAVLTRLDGTDCWVHIQASRSPKVFGLHDAALIAFEDTTGNIELMTTLMLRNEDLFRRNRELEIAAKVERLLLDDTDLEYRLAAALREAASTIGAGCGLIWTRSGDGQEIVVRGACGLGTNLLANSFSLRLDEESLATRAVRKGQSQTAQDLDGESGALRDLARQFGITSALAAPMIAHDDVIGVLVLGERGTRRSFSDEETLLVEVVANSAASAVCNALLTQDMEVSRAYWQRAFDAISDLILVVDASGKILRVNEAVASRLQTSASALLGESCEGFIPGLGDSQLKQIVTADHHKGLGSRDIAGERCEVTVFPLSRVSGGADAVVIYARIIANKGRLRKAA
jgi:PAS domain-containing protein